MSLQRTNASVSDWLVVWPDLSIIEDPITLFEAVCLPHLQFTLLEPNTIETRVKKKWMVRRGEREEAAEKITVRTFGRKTGISEAVAIRGKYEIKIMRSKTRAEIKEVD